MESPGINIDLAWQPEKLGENITPNQWFVSRDIPLRYLKIND